MKMFSAPTTSISPIVKGIVSGAFNNSGDAGLTSNPSYGMALQAALSGYTSPYIAQLKQAFGNPAQVSSYLDQGLSKDDLTPAQLKAITGANAGMASALSALPGAVAKDAADLVPGAIDTETLGALSSVMKWALGGQLTSSQLDSIPGLRDNPEAMALAQTMWHVFGQQDAIPSSVPARPAMPSGVGAPLASSAYPPPPAPYTPGQTPTGPGGTPLLGK